MEQFVVDQVKYGLKLLPKNLFKSFVKPKSNLASERLRRRGFIRGVCHPGSDYARIKGANIEWVRLDIPFPYDKDGKLSQSYLGFKARCAELQANGLKVMAITPYPQDYADYGADIRDKANEAKVAEITVFIITDLAGLINGVQVTNEMGIPRFTIPFTMDDAARFIAVQLKALNPVKGDLIVGYNSAGPAADLHVKLGDYWQYCDYIGIDMYLGCFYNLPGFMWIFDAMCRYMWAMTGLPVIVQEFGYIGDGKPKTAAEKKEILRGYGFESEAAAKADIEKFVDALPERLSYMVKNQSYNKPENYADVIFNGDLANHLYKELPATTVIPGYEHTPEGQAKFYDYVLPYFYSKPYICGAIVYCWFDSDKCYVCGQSGCPTETRWGLVTVDGEPKPAYYAVLKRFGEIARKDAFNGAGGIGK